MSGDVTRPGSVEHPPPTGATVKRLFATALWCGKPGCPQSLHRTSETGAQVLNSEMARIHARSEGGPRWDPAMSKDDNRHYENLILLCRQHAKEIDETPDHFPLKESSSLHGIHTVEPSTILSIQPICGRQSSDLE